jgi:hypothetical protein
MTQVASTVPLRERTSALRSNAELAGIQTELTGIAHLLRDQQMEVPPYQRSYSWGLEQVEAFWTDLRAALVAEQPVYFLGTVVLTAGESDRTTVIDGQQRLATTSLLMTAVRDVFRARGDDVSANQVESQYVQSTSLLRQQLEPRLLLNHRDRDFYEEYVLHGRQNPIVSPPESNARLREGYNFLRSRLKDDIESSGPYWRDRLLAWIQLLDSRARVIAVTVRDDADAFLIFETLNDRGLALTVADVIKNYLFGLCRDRTFEAEQSWIHAVQTLEDAGSPLPFTTFLRQWWTSAYGATRERDLYQRLRTEVHSRTAALEALASMRVAAEPYAAILSPDHELWRAYGTSHQSAAAVLADLGLEQYRPLLLAAMLHFEETELLRLMRAMVSWSVRGLIVGGIGGGTTERYYAEAAVAVTQGRVRTAEQVLIRLEPIVPGDREFFSQFAARRVYKTRLLSYYLHALSERNAVPGTREVRTVAIPILSAGVLATIPTSDVEQQQLRRIGNYILVDEREVWRLESDDEARLDLVREYASDWIEWLTDGIEHRQRTLARDAAFTWPREPNEQG